MNHFWLNTYKLTLNGGIVMKGRRIIIPSLLQRQILEQLHINHMGFEKMRLLAKKLVHYVNMNVDIKMT